MVALLMNGSPGTAPASLATHYITSILFFLFWGRGGGEFRPQSTRGPVRLGSKA